MALTLLTNAAVYSQDAPWAHSKPVHRWLYTLPRSSYGIPDNKSCHFWEAI